MRVIAGYLGGRIFDSPRGHRTHPMSEKMRGAIFGALGDIENLTVLDAFSGSGALAIEAISRGAKEAVAIEVDKDAHAVIQKNAKSLGIDDRLKAVRAFAGAWSTRHQAKKYDLVLMDPPYDDIPFRDIDRIQRHLNEDGVMILSLPAKMQPWRIPELELIQQKKYGDGQLLFYKWTTD